MSIHITNESIPKSALDLIDNAASRFLPTYLPIAMSKFKNMMGYSKVLRCHMLGYPTVTVSISTNIYVYALNIALYEVALVIFLACPELNYKTPVHMSFEDKSCSDWPTNVINQVAWQVNYLSRSDMIYCIDLSGLVFDECPTSGKLDLITRGRYILRCSGPT